MNISGYLILLMIRSIAQISWRNIETDNDIIGRKFTIPSKLVGSRAATWKSLLMLDNISDNVDYHMAVEMRHKMKHSA